VKSSHELKIELEEVGAKLKPLLGQRETLQRAISKAMSLEWIAANNVKREDIITPDDKDLPYFGDLKRFSEYLVGTNCQKKWATWNGKIYNAAELKLGRVDWDNSPGQLDDVPEGEA
jgi:hypothetical protein